MHVIRLRHVCRTLWVATVCALPLSVPVPAVAQEAVATTFGELRFKVGPGDRVFVTTNDGVEHEARIVELNSSSLVVSIGRIRRELAEDSVRRIRGRVPDPIGGGAALGAGIGAGLMMALTSQIEDTSVVLTGLIYGGIGALVGMGIDAAVQGKATIYEPRRSARSIVVQPTVGPRATGLMLGLRF